MNSLHFQLTGRDYYGICTTLANHRLQHRGTRELPHLLGPLWPRGTPGCPRI